LKTLTTFSPPLKWCGRRPSRSTILSSKRWARSQ
jgi:hypothetical protein